MKLSFKLIKPSLSSIEENRFEIFEKFLRIFNISAVSGHLLSEYCTQHHKQFLFPPKSIIPSWHFENNFLTLSISSRLVYSDEIYFNFSHLPIYLFPGPSFKHNSQNYCQSRATAIDLKKDGTSFPTCISSRFLLVILEK